MRPLSFEERVIILGVTYSGKSHFAKSMLSQCSRFVVFDLRGEYAKDIPGTLKMGVSEFARFAMNNRARFSDAEAPLRLSVTPSPQSAESTTFQAAEFRDFVRVCESTLADCVIVIEEVGQFEDNGKAHAAINYLATQSRHWGCPLVLVAQCAVQIPKISRRQAHRVYSFRQVDKDDLRALAQYLGDEAAKLPLLKQGEHIGYDAATFQVTRVRRD